MRKVLLLVAVAALLPAPARAAGDDGYEFRLGGERVRAANVFPDVARHSLASPYRVNRQRTMTGLGEIGGRVAIALLTEVLDGAVARRRPDDPGEDADAGERPWRQEERLAPEEDLGDAAFAARVLARLGHRESLPRLRELSAVAEGADRAAFEAAIAALEQ